MIAVLDTNVLASGTAGFLLPMSTPGRLLHAWREDAFVLVLSEPIMVELARTLDNPYFRQRITSQQVETGLTLIHEKARVISPTAVIAGAASHPEDDPVLATAVSAQADYLVTGDKQLQRLGTYRGVAILSPREFLDVLARQEEAAP